MALGLSWAKRLRQIAHRADIVVLHIGNRDIVPMIAFANKEQLPPIVYLDHSDHLFWLGACISDIVVNFRKSGMRLSQERRGIEARRNVMLPIPLECFPRTFSRREAKMHLGFPEKALFYFPLPEG